MIVCLSRNASLHNQTNYRISIIIHYRCSSLRTYNGHYNDTSIHTGHVLKITDEPHEDSYSLSNGETALSDDANASIEFKQIQTSNSTVEAKPEKPIDKKSIDDEIEFHDGWLPDHYEWVVWLNINLFFRLFFAMKPFWNRQMMDQNGQINFNLILFVIIFNWLCTHLLA